MGHGDFVLYKNDDKKFEVRYINPSIQRPHSVNVRELKKTMMAMATRTPENKMVHTEPHYFRTRRIVIDNACRWSLFLFGFCFIDIFCCVFAFYTKHFSKDENSKTYSRAMHVPYDTPTSL